jgi:hypothetical protein
MEEDANVAIDISCLVFHIKKEVVGVLDYFLSFLRRYEKKPIICFFDVGP